MRDVTNQHRMLTFRGGGWVILLASLICIGLISWAVGPAIFRQINRPPGDGKNIESYLFDLSSNQIPLEKIAIGYQYRDLVAPLDQPPFMTIQEAKAFNEEIRGKFIVPTDRVIGVVVNGQARAYPISVLNNHEIINDTLGGVPIAVTYNPPCDSAVVFDRRSPQDSTRTISFGVSGMLYNSNLLMYDRHPDGATPEAVGGESLWSQLLGRAVTGPAATSGLTLDVLPASLTTWGPWGEMHPNTTVLKPDKGMLKRYKEVTYAEFRASDDLMFEVEPMPPGPEAGGVAPKTKVLVASAGGEQRAWTKAFLATQAGESREYRETLGGIELIFTRHSDAEHESITVRPADAEADIDVRCCYWFAWYAMNPETLLISD